MLFLFRATRKTRLTDYLALNYKNWLEIIKTEMNWIEYLHSIWWHRWSRWRWSQRNPRLTRLTGSMSKRLLLRTNVYATIASRSATAAANQRPITACTQHQRIMLKLTWTASCTANRTTLGVLMKLHLNLWFELENRMNKWTKSCLIYLFF